MALYSNSVKRCRMKPDEKNVMKGAKGKAGVTSGSIEADVFMVPRTRKQEQARIVELRKKKAAAKNKRLRQAKKGVK